MNRTVSICSVFSSRGAPSINVPSEPPLGSSETSRREDHFVARHGVAGNLHFLDVLEVAFLNAMHDVRGCVVAIKRDLGFDSRVNVTAVAIALLNRLRVAFVGLWNIAPDYGLHGLDEFIVVEYFVAAGFSSASDRIGAFLHADGNVDAFTFGILEFRIGNFRFETPVVAVPVDDVLKVGFKRCFVVFAAETARASISSPLRSFRSDSVSLPSKATWRIDLAFVDGIRDANARGAYFFDEDVDAGVRETPFFIGVEKGLASRRCRLRGRRNRLRAR